MLKPCFLAFVEDLEFRSKLEEIAKLKQLECYLAGQGEQLSQLAKTLNPFLIIMDLSGSNTEWLFKHIAFIKFTKSTLTIIAITNPSEEQSKDRAESYGCDIIILKPDFLKKIPDFIDKVLRKG